MARQSARTLPRKSPQLREFDEGSPA
ncbi:hypothetical protein LCGC14_1870610, partial [marine sediment metagenome]